MWNHYVTPKGDIKWEDTHVIMSLQNSLTVMWHTDSSFDIIVRQSHFDSTFPFSEPTRTPAIVLALTYLVLADNFLACLRSRTLLSHFFSQKWCFVFECPLSLLGTVFSQPFRLTASDISGKAEAIKPVAFAILPHIHFPSLLEAMGRLHWCLHVLFCDLFSLLLTFSLSIRAFDVLCHLIPSGCCV